MMMTSTPHRVFNFCAGPATIPTAVLQQAQQELLDWRGSGMSVMEISHRSPEFLEYILQPAERNLRQLLNIPANYHVLFVSTGTSHQFSMVPLNLLARSSHRCADYFHTGVWSGKAICEAKRFGDIQVPVDSEANDFTDIAPPATWKLNPEAAYVHYTPNETVNGLEFSFVPETGDIPLVADMSSTLLSRPLAIEKFGLIYAGAQKNIGPAGLTLVIIRKDLLEFADAHIPRFYHYQTYAQEKSLANTPATFAIYLAGLVFEWLLAQGGLTTMGERNQHKASKLYQAIDHSQGFYKNRVNPCYRSWMNVIFNLPTVELEQRFISEAKQAGLANLKGHKLVGGIRASIYNAMPEAGVDALLTFMQDFKKYHA